MIIAFARRGQEIGQFPEDEVPALVASGQILPSDDYRHEGMDEWRKVGDRWPVAEVAHYPTTPVMTMDDVPTSSCYGFGLVFGLIAALLIAGGAYWYLDLRLAPEEPAAVAQPTEQIAEPRVLPRAAQREAVQSEILSQTELVDSVLASAGRPIAFLNDQLPADASDPLVNAKYTYSRERSSFSRKSVMDVEVWVLDKKSSAIQEIEAVKSKIISAYGDVYGWDAQKWETQLRDGGVSEPQLEGLLRERSDLFWESLAQNLALQFFGEAPTFPPAASSSAKTAIPEAETVLVRTTVPGDRDLINSVTRRISIVFRRQSMSEPDLLFEVFIPQGLRLPTQPPTILDEIPTFKQGAERPIRELQVRFGAKRKKRTVNADYPDYNLVYIPLRHLVLDGRAPNEKQAEPRFENLDTFVNSARQLLTSMAAPPSSAQVAEKLRASMQAEAYPGIGVNGIEEYSKYVREIVAAGLVNEIDHVEIVANGDVVLKHTVERP
jgi:hypothetical protein